MIRSLAGVALVLALAVCACGGDSAEERAQNKVCSARADTSLSASDAEQQIRTALEGLASSYAKALAPIDCAS